MAEFRCGECEVCKPTPCRNCRFCGRKEPGKCEEVVSARSKQCLNYAALKAEHDAAEAKKVEEREKRRTDVAERRRRAAAAPAPAKNPKKVAGGVKAAKTRKQNQASELQGL